jgi:peroxiredoxin
MSDANQQTNYLPIILVGMGLILVIGSALFLRGSQPLGQEQFEDLILSPVEVDQPAPELSLFDLNGNQVSLSDFKGEVVLLNNWATWCPPCREEMPEIKAYYEKYKNEGFQVVAVEAGQPEAEVRAFIEAQGLEFIVLLDPENQSLITFQQSSLPNSFVIDHRGNLRLAWIGTINVPTMERYITPLLEELP